jgi:hypothetical protein
VVECGVKKGWGDLGEGGEDEAALVHGGMRKGEVGSGDDLARAVGIDVEEEIEIDDARTFGGSVGAIASHGVFDGEKMVENVEWAEVSFQEDGSVEEARLFEVANGIGCVEGGDGGDVAEAGEAAESFAEVGFRWAVG